VNATVIRAVAVFSVAVMPTVPAIAVVAGSWVAAKVTPVAAASWAAAKVTAAVAGSWVVAKVTAAVAGS
jgi:hypothetical protein